MTTTRSERARPLAIPTDRGNATITADGRQVELTNLDKVFWPDLGLTKRDLLQYYADVSGALLPHLQDRAMVMKRYPNGISGKHFFMKRAPQPRPEWIETCAIDHGSGSVIDFPLRPPQASETWRSRSASALPKARVWVTVGSPP